MSQVPSPGAFDTARQIGTVYSLFVEEDLRTLLNGFVDQARAMSMLFAAAGGLIEAQDEAVAAALGKAAEEPVGLQSLGLMGSLGSTTALLDAADGTTTLGGYGRVGPEDVSTSPLERMAEAAQALEPQQFATIAARMTQAATVLDDAATTLRSGLGNLLGHAWQGEFADQATFSTHRLADSAAALAGQLTAVAEKPTGHSAGSPPPASGSRRRPPTSPSPRTAPRDSAGSRARWRRRSRRTSRPPGTPPRSRRGRSSTPNTAPR
ncbi:hypothetical protein M3C36_16150 [Dietzia cinnamea]|uniref:hypothetical protein n=1 Tax=Dietzia cinnamea TaxID=321318 RepID=UPI0021A93BB7|nr:hypothetical protein [Dietzia cinnamea]MCT1886689.1 hypothetical protein [Dietzia cinnamea]